MTWECGDCLYKGFYLLGFLAKSGGSVNI